MPRNPDFEALVRKLFAHAHFANDLGIVLEKVSEGRCETSIAIGRRHQQQNGYIHAGVLATLADHTAGGASASMIAEGQAVLSIEFKINLLRPARGERVECVGTVLKAGRTISVSESEVFTFEGGARVLAAKATVTLAVVPYPSASS